jgi:hypothetical protein
MHVNKNPIHLVNFGLAHYPVIPKARCIFMEAMAIVSSVVFGGYYSVVLGAIILLYWGLLFCCIGGYYSVVLGAIILLYLGALLSIYFNYVGSRSIYLTRLTWFSYKPALNRINKNFSF